MLRDEVRMLLKLIFVFTDAKGAARAFLDSGEFSNNGAQAIGLRFELILTEPVTGRSLID